MLQVKIKRYKSGRSRRYYLNPDNNQWMLPNELIKYINSLGLTEQDWYNDRILPKDENGPIIPTCDLDGCNEPCRFLGVISGYYRFCSLSHGRKFERGLKHFIEKYGEEEGTKRFNDIKNKRRAILDSVRNGDYYINKYGEEEGKRLHDLNFKKCNTKEAYIRKYGEEEGIKRYNHKISKFSHSMSLEGFIERYGEEGFEKYESVKDSRKLTHQKFIEKYGETEGQKRWNSYIDKQRVAGLSKPDFRKTFRSLEGYISYYGEEEGRIRWNNRISRISGSYSTDPEKIKSLGYDNPEELARLNFIKRSKSHSLDRYKEIYGEDEGEAAYESFTNNISHAASLEGLIELYGQDKGTEEWNKRRNNSSYYSSVTYYIDRYGEDLGVELFASRINKMKAKTSKISRRLFDQVTSNLYGLVNLSNVHYSDDEYCILTGLTNCDIKKARYLDFCITSYKICIEFDGDYWHPTITEEDIIEFSTGVVRNWDVLNELSREYALTKLGWKILHIKEHDYRQNPEHEVKRCVDFIRSIVCK